MTLYLSTLNDVRQMKQSSSESRALELQQEKMLKESLKH